jgi:hypothetical protein
MANENSSSNPAPVPNPYTADVQEKIARLRALAAEVPDADNPKPLTPAQLALVSKTSAEFLEKAAVFADAVPTVATALSGDAVILRDAIAFELAWSALVDEATVLTRRASQAIARHKYPAVVVARSMYRVGKGYVKSGPGDAAKTHVVEMGRSLARRKSHRRPPAAPAPAPHAAHEGDEPKK